MKTLITVVVSVALLFSVSLVQAQELEGDYSIKHSFTGCRDNLNQKTNVPSQRINMFVEFSRTDANGTDVYHLCAGTSCNQNTAIGHLWHHDGDINGRFHIYDPTYLTGVVTPGESWGRYTIDQNFNFKSGWGFVQVYQQPFSGPFTSCKVTLSP